MPPPDPNIDFDLSHITPGLVKSTLKKCSSKSSPGLDRITYHHLKKLPSTLLFLANLFSKILSSSNECPPFWCSAKSILIRKKGDPNLPSNFRPIALTSCVGKLFHKIIANRLQSFLIDNGIIDTSCQKGFISGFNSVMEHILTLNAMMEDCKSLEKNMAVTFIDLKNAFGSVSHTFLLDMLFHLKVPYKS